MIRVFVVAPTPMMQAGLQSMLNTETIQVVGAVTGTEASRPMADADVLVLADDLHLEEVAQALMEDSPSGIVVLAEGNERLLARLQAVTIRSWGIVALDASAAQLQAAVAAVAQGFITIPSEQGGWLTRDPFANYGSMKLEATDEALTPREREVLQLVSQGLSNKLIARALHISEHTVKFHISSVTSKLGASSRTDAVRRGLRSGLITL